MLVGVTPLIPMDLGGPPAGDKYLPDRLLNPDGRLYHTRHLLLKYGNPFNNNFGQLLKLWHYLSGT